jgi:hypothetical protein
MANNKHRQCAICQYWTKRACTGSDGPHIRHIETVKVVVTFWISRFLVGGRGSVLSAHIYHMPCWLFATRSALSDLRSEVYHSFPVLCSPPQHTQRARELASGAKPAGAEPLPYTILKAKRGLSTPLMVAAAARPGRQQQTLAMQSVPPVQVSIKRKSFVTSVAQAWNGIKVRTPRPVSLAVTSRLF